MPFAIGTSFDRSTRNASTSKYTGQKSQTRFTMVSDIGW